MGSAASPRRGKRRAIKTNKRFCQPRADAITSKARDSQNLFRYKKRSEDFRRRNAERRVAASPVWRNNSTEPQRSGDAE
jgi:hypothetical protein